MKINKQISKLHNLIEKIGASLLAIISIIGVLLLCVAFTTRVNAASIVVTTLTDEILDDDLCSLREAITNANNDDSTYGDCAPGSGEDFITFDELLGEGTIILTSALPSIGDLDGLTIDGCENIAINGDDQYQIFYIEQDIPANLSNLNIEHGYGENGGAIYNAGYLVINNCILNDNSAISGGGLYNYLGNFTVENSIFTQNYSENDGGGIRNVGYSGESQIINSFFTDNIADSYGGGIHNGTGGGAATWESNLSIINTIISGNTCSYGGGISNAGGQGSLNTINISNCGISMNTATANGGGIYSQGGTKSNSSIFIKSTSIYENSSSQGGGIASIYENKLYIQNSSIFNNSADFGGGIYFKAREGIILNNTFSNNNANDTGASIYVEASEILLKNNIIANSSNGGDCYGFLSNLSSNNLIEDTGQNACGLINGTNGNITGIDPDLGLPTGSPPYIPLLGQSVAIENGNDATCAADPVNNESQNNVIRPYGIHCDIGAYEFDKPIAFSIERLDSSPTNVQIVNFSVTFTVSVTGVDITDFVLSTTDISGASIVNVSGSESVYTVSVNTGSGDGTIRLDLIDDDSVTGPEGEFLGGDGLANGDFIGGETYIIEKTPPLVDSIAITNPNPTKAETVNFLVTFSEPITGLDVTDFSITAPNLTGTNVSEVNGEGYSYTITVNPGSGSGTLRLDLVDNDSITDEAGNKLGGVGLVNGDFYTGESYTIDRNPPYVVSSVCANPNPTTATTVYYIVTFSEPVTGVDINDFGLTTNGISYATVFGVSGSGSEYTVAINTGSGNGTIRLDINDNDSINDEVLNPLGGEGQGNGDFIDGEVYIINYIPYTIFMPLVTNGN